MIIASTERLNNFRFNCSVIYAITEKNKIGLTVEKFHLKIISAQY